MFVITGACSHSRARVGRLTLPHASLQTPAFMPVGTLGTVKAMTPGELHELGFRLILANTYHLHLRPGEQIVAQAGGVHRFAGWDGAVLTDSGGFQVFSLARLRSISDDGVEFQSHIDGSTHVFTPESVMDMQRAIGADIVMAFDECAPYPCDESYAREAMERTHRWAVRCAHRHRATGGHAEGGWVQALFGIVQGATYENLRRESAQRLAALDLPGYAIGGLAVGEPRDTRCECVEWCTEILPEAKPRYLMGVGSLADILDAVERGIDLFDCVLPTRNARNGQIITWNGPINIRNARYAKDFSPPDPACPCQVCRRHTRAYLRHLFMAREILAYRLATYHNLALYAAFMEKVRAAIAQDCLATLREPAERASSGED
ncbi:MAG: tRNA guanosine(34) transglycosylase Tgt [Chthonomonadales bacterium]